MQKDNRENERKHIEKMRSLQKEMKEEHASNVAGSFHVNSTSVFHGPPQIVLKFGTVVEHG